MALSGVTHPSIEFDINYIFINKYWACGRLTGWHTDNCRGYSQEAFYKFPQPQLNDLFANTMMPAVLSVPTCLPVSRNNPMIQTYERTTLLAISSTNSTRMANSNGKSTTQKHSTKSRKNSQKSRLLWSNSISRLYIYKNKSLQIHCLEQKPVPEYGSD